MGYFHATGDPAQVIDDETHFVKRSVANIFGVIVRRENEFTHGDRDVQGLSQLGESLQIVGWQTIAGIDETGESVHIGDFRAQLRRTHANITGLLAAEGATWKD